VLPLFFNLISHFTYSFPSLFVCCCSPDDILLRILFFVNPPLPWSAAVFFLLHGCILDSARLLAIFSLFFLRSFIGLTCAFFFVLVLLYLSRGSSFLVGCFPWGSQCALHFFVCELSTLPTWPCADPFNIWLFVWFIHCLTVQFLCLDFFAAIGLVVRIPFLGFFLFLSLVRVCLFFFLCYLVGRYPPGFFLPYRDLPPSL